MQKVLIVVRDFPPYSNSLGGVIRMLKLTNFLQRNSIDVHIVTAAGDTPLGYFGYEAEVKKMKVHYVRDKFQAFNVKKWKARFDQPVIDKTDGEKTSLFSALKKGALPLLRPLFIPDPGIAFTSGITEEAIRIIKQEGITNVLVSSPPHSTQIIGWRIKRRLGDDVNYILDYRDSWNTLGIFSRKNAFAKMISEWLEAKALRAADHITYQSSTVLPKLNQKFFDVSAKSTLVMNGFDGTMGGESIESSEPSEKLKIGYFGAISDSENSFRNPSALLSVVAESDLPVELIFYGDVQLDPKWNALLGDAISMPGSLSHQEALQKMSEMDVLMLLHTQLEGSDEVIPGKLFEYMVVETPILVMGPDGMAARKIVEEEGVGYSVNATDKSDVASAVNKMVDDWKSGSLPCFEVARLEKYSRDVQYSNILPLLK